LQRGPQGDTRLLQQKLQTLDRKIQQPYGHLRTTIQTLLVLCLIRFKKVASAQRVILNLRMTPSKSQLCPIKKVIHINIKFHVLKDTLFWICIKMVTLNDPFLDDGLNFTLLMHLVMEACFRKVISNILEKYEAFCCAPKLDVSI